MAESTFNEIAVVDLGSNSFKLQMARIQSGQLFFHDSMRESVRLGAGLDAQKYVNQETLTLASDCLKRFGERLRGLNPDAVRVVATNTFRVAKNAFELIQVCEAALGFPIEVIAGREEARMIFIGVSHGLPFAEHARLVIDIGGGSTEFIVGRGFEPKLTESLYMGCVSFSRQFFADGQLSAENFKEAEIAAMAEIDRIRTQYLATDWQEAVGSSGTARALGEVLAANDWSNGEINIEGLNALKNKLIGFHEIKKIDLKGLSTDRSAVVAGGLSIMLAAFNALNIGTMTTASSALREGVLYEMLGRLQHHDTRESTASDFMKRYHVDKLQAARVKKMALHLLAEIHPHLQMNHETAEQYISWAADLHEIGISIAHSGYHKHSAYIVENADMPGFSKKEQELLGFLVRVQRRSPSKITMPKLADDRAKLMLIIRLSVLFSRNRTDNMPYIKLDVTHEGFVLHLEAGWLDNNPLTETELEYEAIYWKGLGIVFDVPKN